MKTKDTSYGEYAIIKEPDVPVLYSMSENCRGVKRRVHFEEDAGIMKGFFTKIKHGKRIGCFGVDEMKKLWTIRTLKAISQKKLCLRLTV